MTEPIMRPTPLLSLLALLGLAGCMRDQQARFAHLVDSLQRAGAARAGGSSGADPCALVSRAEAEQVLGTLRHDPYRMDGSGDPDPEGSVCRYETQTGRHLGMDVSFDGALIGMRAIGLGAQIASPVFGADSAKIAALGGHWDEARLLPGHLMARKGDAMVDMDYFGSRAGLPGAARLADIALGRIGSPLPYDGAAAARTAPGPLVTPRDPCTLVDRGDVEAILGKLAGDPSPDPDQSGCTYTLAASRGLGGQEVHLQVQWRDGFMALEGSRSTAALVQQHVGVSVPAGAGADSGFGKFMQQVQGALRSQGVGTQMGNGGVVTDTAVAGPWDEASLIAGVGFSAVKEDVLLSLDLRTIPYDQAKALIAKAMQRL
jgi:hypothetical protein